MKKIEDELILSPIDLSQPDFNDILRKVTYCEQQIQQQVQQPFAERLKFFSIEQQCLWNPEISRTEIEAMRKSLSTELNEVIFNQTQQLNKIRNSIRYEIHMRKIE